MSQVSTSTTTITTPPVTVVSSSMSSLSLVTMAPSLMGLPTRFGQHDVVLLSPQTQRGSGGVIGLASVLQQQPPSWMPLQACANYAMGSPQVASFFRVEPPIVLSICLMSVLVFAFYFQVPCWMPYPPLGAQLLGSAPFQPLGVYPWHAYVQPGDGHQPTPGMHRVAAPSTTLSGGALCCSVAQSAVPQPSHLYGGAYSFGGLAESHPIPLPYLHDGEGSSFPGLVPSDDMVNSKSVMGVKPSDSGVMIGYQVDEFTHTCSAEWVVAHSHIYPGFTGKGSSLTQFPLEPGCEDYSFLDQAMADFEQGLDSMLTDPL